MVITTKASFPADAICRKRKHVDENVKALSEGWVSWHAASATEGEDVLLEQVESGHAPSRPHPNLLANFKIKYQRNRQVFLSDCKFQKRERAVDENVLSEM